MFNSTIMLVEDNPDDEELTLLALSENQFLQKVIVVHDGAEAIAYLFGTGKYALRDTHVMPQVILLDLNLPKLSGMEVLRRLRKDNRTRLLPVVILTSSKEDADRIQSYNLGANSYIRKPIDFTQFKEIVRQLGIYWLILNESPPV